MDKDAEENGIENYENYIYKFHYKENVLSEPLKVTCRTLGFAHCWSGSFLIDLPAVVG
jgi:hypothetical protein